MQDVVQTKLPTTWIRENADFFRTAVNVPFVSELDDDDVQHWVSRAQRDDASYEQLRDATLYRIEVFREGFRGFPVWKRFSVLL